MRSGLTAALIGSLGLALAATQARAMQFEQAAISPTEIIIGGHGPIVKGDTIRLQQALAEAPPDKTMLGLALDSPGGSVVEGEQLARLIRARGLPVLIPSNSKCVSACFLLLAASPHRLAAADALVGVHSASEDGEETDTALAVTTLMARAAADLGVPPAIIGKMVQTRAASVEWLTPADLASMGVTIFDGDTPAAAEQPGTDLATRNPAGPSQPASPLSTPLPQQAFNLPTQPRRSVTPPPPVATGGFAAGRDDRRAWNAWLAGLHGPYREGAVFALTQFSLSKTLACDTSQEIDFTMGCESARQRLAPVGYKRRGDPDYAAGWDGTVSRSSAASPVLPTAPTEAEYQGAYFCGRQVAHLTLTVFSASPAEHRRAMFSFGPAPTSPTVPHGAFIVEGSIEVHGGQMSLAPVQWVSQPGGYNWLGLDGRSEDGGRTFSGRVVDSNNICTKFTLQRMGGGPTSR